MQRFLNKIRAFLSEEDAVTAVEYAMVIMLVFLACLTAVNSLGHGTADSFENSANLIDTAISQPS